MESPVLVRRGASFVYGFACCAVELEEIVAGFEEVVDRADTLRLPRIFAVLVGTVVERSLKSVQKLAILRVTISVSAHIPLTEFQTSGEKGLYLHHHLLLLNHLQSLLIVRLSLLLNISEIFVFGFHLHLGSRKQVKRALAVISMAWCLRSGLAGGRETHSL